MSDQSDRHKQQQGNDHDAVDRPTSEPFDPLLRYRGRSLVDRGW